MKRWHRALLVGTLVLVASAGLAEIGLRWLLFGEGELAKSWGANVRQAHYFGDPLSDDEYWKLQHIFSDPATRLRVPHPDRVLGWTGSFIGSRTYEHVDADRVRGRTPVLLYGDSFAQCVTPRRRCFQAVLETSDLGDQYAMLNYGVGGYGLDQIYLMLLRSIDAWVASDPIVIIGILVEEDLNRSALSFRGWPKPRFVLQEGELTLLEPPTVIPDEWIEGNPPAIASYLARALVYKRGLLPAALQRPVQKLRSRRKEKIELNTRILEEIQRELEARELRYFFYLFNNLGYIVRGEVSEWETLIAEFCAQRSIPVLSARPYLIAAAGGSPEECRTYFDLNGAHLTALGNRVAFEGMREGLQGRTGGADTSRIMAMLADGSLAPELELPRERAILGLPARVVNRSRSACIKEENGALWLRAGETGPTEVVFRLDGRARRFRGSASFDVQPGRFDRSFLEIRTDGHAQTRHRLAVQGSFEIDIDLTLVRKLQLTVECPDQEPGGWVIIRGASIE